MYKDKTNKRGQQRHRGKRKGEKQPQYGVQLTYVQALQGVSRISINKAR